MEMLICLGQFLVGLELLRTLIIVWLYRALSDIVVAAVPDLIFEHIHISEPNTYVYEINCNWYNVQYIPLYGIDSLKNNNNCNEWWSIKFLVFHLNLDPGQFSQT